MVFTLHKHVTACAKLKIIRLNYLFKKEIEPTPKKKLKKKVGK